MPDVNEYDNEKDWMAACVPMMVGEGKKQDQAVAACMTIWAKKGEAVKGGEGSGNFGHEGRPGEIGGSGGGGAMPSAVPQSNGWANPREEFRFVQRRLSAGGLKKGERRMLERRSERLAKEVLGVTG